jgi:HEAT repeat protein
MSENHEQPKGLLKNLRHTDDTPGTSQEGEKRALLLIASLRDEQAQHRAVLALIALGAVAVVPLIEVLGDKNEQVWRLASVALVKIGQPAVQPLVDALKHDNEQIRLLSAAALHKMNILRPGSTGWNLMWHEYRKLLRHQRKNLANS